MSIEHRQIGRSELERYGVASLISGSTSISNSRLTCLQVIIILEINNATRCILLVDEGPLELETVDEFEPEVYGSALLSKSCASIWSRLFRWNVHCFAFLHWNMFRKSINGTPSTDLGTHRTNIVFPPLAAPHDMIKNTRNNAAVRARAGYAFKSEYLRRTTAIWTLQSSTNHTDRSRWRSIPFMEFSHGNTPYNLKEVANLSAVQIFLLFCS